MNWVDKILNSDAAKCNPEAAKAIVEAAGGEVPTSFVAVSVEEPPAVSDPPLELP